MKLLTEYNLFDYKQDDVEKSLEENNGFLVLSGIIQKANTLNQNGRVYPRHILEREVRNYQKFILENRALGALDHPDSAVVELKTVSHMMLEARMEGDVVFGKLKVLNTSCGKELQALIKDGVKIGISSRGVGSLKKEGDQNVVQEDFQLICWDVVSEPSTPGAFVMKEGREISPEELKAVFSKQDRLARVLNDILLLKNKS